MNDNNPVLLEEAEYTVRMADVDAARVIYYASPLRWQEMLVSDWFIHCGHSLSDQLGQSTNCPCVEVRVNYRCPVRLDDQLTLRLTVERVGRTSFGLLMTATTPAGALAVEVRTVNVSTAVDEDGDVRSLPMPEWLQRELTGLARQDR